ncbi:hypothetical protein HO133_006733 [Letharia lupina]|uniref:Uncharacterized protein n=1 Tax=Letharia lupina TaxID=560253 RepID=A0A8H6C6P0_9LECA|nr:uncharacterized protein HO133_006733 [Letharia lupina]KAF6217631.1 hypothetical protein HO133_006733 [Letharia lupina]
MDAASNMAKSASDTAQSTFNSASESVKGTSEQASKEGNKNIAEDSDQSAGTRASAAKDAASNKVGEVKHSS